MHWDTIKVNRSNRRKKTIEGKIKENTLHIYIPDGISTKQERTYITTITNKMKKKKQRNSLNSDHQLSERAERLNQKYFDGKLDFSIRFVTNQQKKYGSCTPTTKTIRLSHRIADFPQFVQDYLIVHELAHLIHPNHSKKFWEIVHQYPMVERAKGFLYAVEYLSDKKN
mgnify:FL=1